MPVFGQVNDVKKATKEPIQLSNDKPAWSLLYLPSFVFRLVFYLHSLEYLQLIVRLFGRGTGDG